MPFLPPNQQHQSTEGKIATNHNKMPNIFVFGNLDYGLKLCAETNINLSFGLKPDFKSGLSFGLQR